EEEHGAEEAAGFQGHQEEVREGAGGDEEGPVQVGRHGLVRPPFRRALRDRLETAPRCHDHLILLSVFSE
ncbi:unnamed protein product, partial [Linum tenue]